MNAKLTTQACLDLLLAEPSEGMLLTASWKPPFHPLQGLPVCVCWSDANTKWFFNGELDNTTWDSTPAFGIQVLRAAYITLISPAPSYLGAKITCEEHYVIISKRETQEIQVFVLDNLPPY